MAYTQCAKVYTKLMLITARVELSISLAPPRQHLRPVRKWVGKCGWQWKTAGKWEMVEMGGNGECNLPATHLTS